uniref:Ig-like domain-containing protein n=1 Tax=Anguilla anguilla TaxID=7936 RepID=A0A0E9XY37_ANGAN
MYSSKVIGRVLGGKLLPLDDPEYKGRVHWDSRTGLFSLSGLRLYDSGVYTVEKNDEPRSVSTFNLTVWKGDVPVSKPSVTFISKEYPCTLKCTVENGTKGTLFWYRDSEKNPQGGSPFSIAPHWDQIQAALGRGNYTCEANNSVSNDKTSVNLEDHCRGGAAGIWQTEGSKMWSLCLVLIVMLCSRLV